MFNCFHLLEDFAGERVDGNDALDVVAEELDAQRQFLVGGLYFQRIAADAELAAGEVDVVALVLHVDKLAQQLLPAVMLAPS